MGDATVMKRILSARGVRGAVFKEVAYNHLAYIREIVDRIYVNGFDLVQSHFFIIKNIGGMIMNDDKDEVQRCAEKYGFLVDEQITYQIGIFSEYNKSINDFEIKFFPSEFKHLTSLHKLKNFTDSSETMYEKARGIYKGEKIFSLEDVNKSTWLFDDMAKPDDKTDEEFSIEIKEAKGQHKVLKSDLLDRLSALENLYDIFDKLKDKSNDITLKLYQWDRNAHHSDRPHNSTIGADFLLEFHDANNSEKPFTDFFIIRKNNIFVGMSIFHSEFTYSEDTREFQARTGINRKVPELEVLSVKEIPSETILMSKSPEYIAECQRIQTEYEKRANSIYAQKNAMYSEQFNNLKIRRLELVKLESKPVRNEHRINESQKYYQEFLMKILPERCPDNEDLIELKIRLQSAQKGAKAESKEYIGYEITAIDNILKLRKTVDELSQLRRQGEDGLDEYSEKIKSAVDCLKSIKAEKALCSYILELLKKQVGNLDKEIDEFFVYEEKKLRDILNKIIESEDAPEARIITMSDVIHESGKKFFFSSIISGEAVALENRIKSKLLHICEEVFDKLRNGIEHIADIVSEKISLFHKTENPPDKTVQEEKNTPADHKEKSEKDETKVLEVYNMCVHQCDRYVEFLNTNDVMNSIELQTGLLFEQQESVQEHFRQPEQVQIEIQKKSKEMEYGD